MRLTRVRIPAESVFVFAIVWPFFGFEKSAQMMVKCWRSPGCHVADQPRQRHFDSESGDGFKLMHRVDSICFDFNKIRSMAWGQKKWPAPQSLIHRVLPCALTLTHESSVSVQLSLVLYTPLLAKPPGHSLVFASRPISHLSVRVVAKLSNGIIGRYFVPSICFEVAQYVLLHTPTVWLSLFSLTLRLKGTCVDHLG
jgi:hypothetical protein